jgi:hypothetical protein
MVQQVVNQFQEVFVPFFLQKPASMKFVNKVAAKLGKGKQKERCVTGITVLSYEDTEGILYYNKSQIKKPLS